MTIDEFRNELRRLLDDAATGGLNVDDLLDAADAELHPKEYFDLQPLNDSRPPKSD